uniref:RING-type E3 ubiquitin transferase n=1 Tax=Petromyzon marinus TaxID=7757 RepID=A0AAJ7UER7_PETMA|nr:E3 ubiquitin-protein ligase RNF169-like [Petromyzon marinus]
MMENCRNGVDVRVRPGSAFCPTSTAEYKSDSRLRPEASDSGSETGFRPESGLKSGLGSGILPRSESRTEGESALKPKSRSASALASGSRSEPASDSASASGIERGSVSTGFREPAPLSAAQCQCPVCLDVLVLPVKMPCGHTLCQSCFTQSMDKVHLSCPLCRRRVATWHRTMARRGSLVDAGLWDSVRRSFPERCRRRLREEGTRGGGGARRGDGGDGKDGDDDDDDGDGGGEREPVGGGRGGEDGCEVWSPLSGHRQSLCEPGELGREFRSMWHKFESERRARQAEEQRASEMFIRELLTVEEAQRRPPPMSPFKRLRRERFYNTRLPVSRPLSEVGNRQSDFGELQRKHVSRQRKAAWREPAATTAATTTTTSNAPATTAAGQTPRRNEPSPTRGTHAASAASAAIQPRPSQVPHVVISRVWNLLELAETSSGNWPTATAPPKEGRRGDAGDGATAGSAAAPPPPAAAAAAAAAAAGPAFSSVSAAAARQYRQYQQQQCRQK